jgi:uncharacterized alkaline shock family protein YloU
MSMVVVSDTGTLTVTDAALTRMVVQATESVEGAHIRRRGVEVAVEPGGAHVRLELSVDFGRVLPDVARDVQERVTSVLGTMCGVNVNAVDVAVEELV